MLVSLLTRMICPGRVGSTASKRIHFAAQFGFAHIAQQLREPQRQAIHQHAAPGSGLLLQHLRQIVPGLDQPANAPGGAPDAGRCAAASRHRALARSPRTPRPDRNRWRAVRPGGSCRNAHRPESIHALRLSQFEITRATLPYPDSCSTASASRSRSASQRAR